MLALMLIADTATADTASMSEIRKRRMGESSSTAARKGSKGPSESRIGPIVKC